MSREEKRAALGQLLGVAKGEILDAYRRGLGCGHEPPVVALKVADDFGRDDGSGVTAKVIDPVELSCMSSSARKWPDILDVPQGHIRVVVTDETDDLLAICAMPIPTE
ncbi:hypothetical protein OJF2_44550 [Aquisphaera giovannonii]|uniref:Uncharacterized protein n=2 Tax=Aquisphaera giovannonii TaxID=406548 RepID=A0A5B9W5L3_9BACT|nr:hypothetical protein OJF2_44550 [Aquisphaera giovannonii]